MGSGPSDSGQGISKNKIKSEKPISQKAFFTILSHFKNTLEYMAECGVKGFDFSEDTLEIIKNPDTKQKPEKESLESIKKELGDCIRCGLCKTRSKIVFGAGNPKAKLMFIGEAPGFEEDRAGLPFVGPAGDLLTKIINAIKMKRDDVYIANVVKCRPPKNRNPLPSEVKKCRPFLLRQIKAIKPEFICALGKFAAQALLETDTPISRLRGRFYDFNGIRLIPTYHPAYLLRHNEKKRDVWKDMKLLMKEMRML